MGDADRESTRKLAESISIRTSLKHNNSKQLFMSPSGVSTRSRRKPTHLINEFYNGEVMGLNLPSTLGSTNFDDGLLSRVRKTL